MRKLFQSPFNSQPMNTIKIAIAIVAIILTAGASYASRTNAEFVFCYPPNSSVLQDIPCPNPQDAICCYTAPLNQGTPIFKENS